MFSGNRKVRSRRPKTAKEMQQEVSPRTKSRQLSREASDVSDRIHRLECFITAAPGIQRRQRLANVNMVPPMELPTPAVRARRRPIAQQRAQRGQNLRLWVEGVVVLGSIAAIVGWLNQWFHFWS